MPGAERLRDCAVLTELVAKQRGADKLLAAICATPAVAFEPQGEVGCHVTPWRAGASQQARSEEGRWWDHAAGMGTHRASAPRAPPPDWASWPACSRLSAPLPPLQAYWLGSVALRTPPSVPSCPIRRRWSSGWWWMESW